MSGLEVVGLVLAIAPLVISGLEHYKDGMGPVKTWLKYDRHLEELIRQLAQQQTHFKQNLIILLESADIESERLDLYDPTLWGGEIADALEEQLGIAFHDYKSVVKNYISLLESIISSFKYLPGLDGNEGVSLPDKYATILRCNPSKDGEFSFTQRLKFTMRRKGVEKLIEKLDESNHTLERFQVKSESIARVEKGKSAKRCKKFFRNFRKVRVHANGLYNSFCRALTPSCHAYHEASLFLETRLPDQKKSGSLNFKVSLVCEHTQKSELSVNVLEENDLAYEEYHLGSKTMINGSRVTKVSISKSGSGWMQGQGHTKVQDLCGTIQQAALEQKGIQFHLHQEVEQLTYTTDVCLRPCSISKQDDITTLYNLLSCGQLALRARMKLALILSSALLQLCDTPWTDGTYWSKHSIFFKGRAPVKICEGGCIMRDEDLDRPFVTHSLGKLLAKEPERLGDATWSLVELGILLVELFLNTTLEEHYKDDPKLLSSDPYERQMLALKWIDMSRNKFYPDSYWLAAKSCIKCQFGDISRSPSWEDEQFQQAVCKNVIAALSEGLQYV